MAEQRLALRLARLTRLMLDGNGKVALGIG
jgi:hypothetical protein